MAENGLKKELYSMWELMMKLGILKEWAHHIYFGKSFVASDSMINTMRLDADLLSLLFKQNG